MREIGLNWAHLYFAINGSPFNNEVISSKRLSKQSIVLTCVPKPMLKMFPFIVRNAFMIKAIGFLLRFDRRESPNNNLCKEAKCKHKLLII